MNDPVTDYPQVGGTPVFGTNNTGDNPPCAFACHDDGTSAGVRSVDQRPRGGATTRYDVMIAAAKGLISNVQALLSNNANLAKNTYLFNVYSFNDCIHQYGTTNMPCTAASCTGPTNAIGAILPGVDTYLDAAMSDFRGKFGDNAIGAERQRHVRELAAEVHDPGDRRPAVGSRRELELDDQPQLRAELELSHVRDERWQMGSNAPAYTREGGFDGPINLAYCTALKNEGVVLAVLETPYVPLDGSDPHVQPYEQTVRHTIFPGGAGRRAPSGGAAVVRHHGLLLPGQQPD